MAIEIALMHGKGSNTEITQKIGTRPAWLVGKDVADRLSIFDGVKKLYDARSMPFIPEHCPIGRPWTWWNRIRW